MLVYTNTHMDPKDFVVLLFYKFVDIADPKALMELHKAKWAELSLKGRMIIAEEGINGTLEGERENTDAYIAYIRGDERFADMPIKESTGTGHSFPRASVKVRNEVVTLGAGRFNVAEETAYQLPASELEEWYKRGEDFVVLDLRNDYELASGQFEKTIDPKLANFRDLPKKLEELKDLKDKKIVTVCTGGIRCEKATCLLKREGFTDVYQLKDGIHTYMQEFPGSNFKGTLFVFDDRLTTDIVPVENKTVIGVCTFCTNPTEKYCSDDSVRPSRKLLCCEACFEIQKDKLRQATPA